MTINEEIRVYLVDLRQPFIDAIQADELATALVEDFHSVDMAQVKEQFYQELVANCLEDWHYTIDAFHGLLFEYELTGGKDESVSVYGIILDNPDEFKIQVEPYNFPWNYGFAQPIEALPGVTFSLLNAVGCMPLSDGHPINTATELLETYILTSYIALHDAIGDFIKTEAFSQLPRYSPFHFIIRSHDSYQPLYIIQ